ncbi:MAG: hypothetical protein FWG79_03120, partial [Bacteroidales bacterium]|nr:hypothetical protein [Bacteroidales bacterium]
NFRRGGDIDEIRVYDRALDDAEILRVSQGEDYRPAPFSRTMAEQRWKDEWFYRYGWTNNQLPPALSGQPTSVRKVQILEAYDHKTWWWKANDGIRETTWPGVYNRSQILGRTDYFVLPDWFCYSTSGHQVRFNMPSEPWNYLEISGGADGQIHITPNQDGSGGIQHFTREKNRERSFHKLEQPQQGQTVVFTNNVQETPIGEFDAFYVQEGDAPEGIIRLSYTLTSASTAQTNPNITDVLEYIRGRHAVDERAVLVGTVGGGNRRNTAQQTTLPMPIVHIVIPSDFRGIAHSTTEPFGARPSTQGWINLHGGLDGIRITLPAMNVPPVANGLFPLNIQVKDPIWSLRNMLNFSFSMKPDQEQVLWLDLRDRILPNDKPIYIAIAGSEGFHAGLLEGARVELVFKDRDDAKTEHIIDRFTQVRDNFSFIIEERPNNRRLHKYVQFENDMTDLLRIDPDHKEGREYWYNYNTSQPKPPIHIAPTPAGVPLWAHLQLEYLKKYRHFVEWQIDNRQIENGEFGGGLSDDSDLGNWFPPLALMGVIPDKIEQSLSMMMEAIYNNDMLEKGISKIQSDGLHSLEEGTNVIGQINLLNIGNPKEVERMMEAAHTVKHHLTGVNRGGHTHFKGDYFSATKIATKGVWGWVDRRTFQYLIPAIYMGEFYGNESAKQNVIDIADGMLAHATTTPDGRIQLHYAIHFDTDEQRNSGIGSAVHVFWAAWRWTGDEKYLKPLLDDGSMNTVTSNMLDIAALREDLMKQPIRTGSEYEYILAWQLSGDKKHLETLYRNLLETATLNEYINTWGYPWTDRFAFRIEQIQRSRMGGVVQDRNVFFAGNAVSWRFPKDDDAEKIAILVPLSTPKELNLEFFNTDNQPMQADMTGWDVLNGEWELVQGIDLNGDGKIDRETSRRKVQFGREETLTLTIPSKQAVLVQLRLVGDGVNITQNRPDLAVGDIQKVDNQITVTVHNLGNASAPETEIVLTDRSGQTVYQTATIPALEGAHDLLPKRVQITFNLPSGVNSGDCQIIIDPKNTLTEIRKTNNKIVL